MPADNWADLLCASGERRFGKQGGVWFDADGGKIVCLTPPNKGIDSHLFGVLKVVVVQLHLVIHLTSVDTGGHVRNSRHYYGRAVDIGSVYHHGPGVPERAATLDNSDAVEMVHYLLEHGFKVGEGKPTPAIIFGPPGTKWNPTRIEHAHHLHCSLPVKRRKA